MKEKLTLPGTKPNGDPVKVTAAAAREFLRWWVVK